MLRNCPNCGAPIKGSKYEYCETLLDHYVHKEIQLIIDRDSLTALTQEAIMKANSAYQTQVLLQTIRRLNYGRI